MEIGKLLFMSSCILLTSVWKISQSSCMALAWVHPWILLAIFFMCNLENKVLRSINLKPLIYCRYDNDIFLIFKSSNDINRIKIEFERNSVLKFIYETEVDKKLTFLDVNLSNNFDKIRTSVHIKATNSGDCMNFNSICPKRYKTGVIKSLLHRSFAISDD